MSLITFINNEKLTIATDKLVYEPDEIRSVHNVVGQAAALMDVLKNEKDMLEDSFQTGYDRGFEKGQTEGYDAALEHIAVKLVVLAKEAHEARLELENKAGVLATKIVEKIATDLGPRKTIAALAKSAASNLVPREPVILRVHPDNTAFVSDEVSPSSTHIVEVMPDPSLSETDCVLETEFGRIKADMNTQLKVLREKLYAS